MWKRGLSRLEFVGGPFDGFSQLVSVESDELPKCVALPLSRKAGRLVGFRIGKPNKSRVAIYRLHHQDGIVQYLFRDMRAVDQSLQPQ
jgi:hypothetical protein